jgi:hypothetical protein
LGFSASRSASSLIARTMITSAAPGGIVIDHSSENKRFAPIEHARKAALEPNRLPAPNAEFFLVLRNYLPPQEMLDGRWLPPAVERVECAASPSMPTPASKQA